MTAHETYIIFSAGWQMLKEIHASSFQNADWENFLEKSRMIYSANRNYAIPESNDPNAIFTKKLLLLLGDVAEMLEKEKNSDKLWEMISAEYNNAWKFFKKFSDNQEEFLKNGEIEYYKSVAEQQPSVFYEKLLRLLYTELFRTHHPLYIAIVRDLSNVSKIVSGY